MARQAPSVNLTQVSEWESGEVRRKEDYLAAEEPLEIRIGEEPLQLAREMQLTLIGFLRERRFVIYSGEERIAK